MNGLTDRKIQIYLQILPLILFAFTQATPALGQDLNETTPSPSKKAPTGKKKSSLRGGSNKSKDLQEKIQKAIGKSSNPDFERIEKVERKYAEAGTVHMKVKKTLTLSVLKKTREFAGDLWLKNGGKLRLDLKGAARSLVVMDGKTLWVMDDPLDPALGKPQVVISDNPKQLKSQALIAFLMGKGRILDEFNLIERVPEKDSNLAIYLLDPKSGENDIKNLRLTLQETDQFIRTVVFSDSLDNETRLDFTEVEFKVPLADKFFKFTPPEGADITRIN